MRLDIIVHITARIEILLITCVCVMEYADTRSVDQKGVNDVKTQMINSTKNEDKMEHVFDNDTYSIVPGERVSGNASSVTERLISATTYTPNDGLPIPILVASPAVAVAITIFICVAYKLHTRQLDNQAKQLAIQVAAGAVQCPSPCVTSSPSRTSQRLLPTIQSTSLRVMCQSESDLPGTRKKSLLRTPSPTSQILLTPIMGDKRGSSWSALSDQEIVNHSPRRHSTFLL